MASFKTEQVGHLISKIGRSLTKRFERTSEPRNHYGQDRLYQIISPFERYFVSIQSILIWEDPYKTAVALIGFNCFYWIVVLLNRSLVCSVCIAAFSYNFYQLWSQHIWPEISLPPESSDLDADSWTPVHPQVLSVPEISQLFNSGCVVVKRVVRWLFALRAQQHGLFTALVCSAFFVTAVVGRTFSGVTIVYLLLMTAALGPGIGMYLVPDSWYEQLRAKLNGDNDENDDDDINGDNKDDQRDAKEINVPDMSLMMTHGVDVQMKEKKMKKRNNDNESLQSTSFGYNLYDQLHKKENLKNDSINLTACLTNALNSNEQLCGDLNKKNTVRSNTSSSVSLSSKDSKGNSNQDICFVHTHFNDNSATDLIQFDNDNFDIDLKDINAEVTTDDDYEIVSDSEIFFLNGQT